MSLVEFAAPAEEPLTQAEAKLFLRVDGTDEDTLITSLIKAARVIVEDRNGRALITQTWDLYADAFPTTGRGLVIPKPRLQTISFVKYIDSAGAIQTLSPSDYAVDTAAEPGWVVPAVNKTWPATQAVLNAVQVRFVCGYGTAAQVPDNVKRAVYAVLADLYQHRDEQGGELPGAADRTMASDKIWGFG